MLRAQRCDAISSLRTMSLDAILQGYDPAEYAAPPGAKLLTAFPVYKR